MAVADMGIDLGTSSILVYVRGKGIVLKEPSVVAWDRDNEEVVAIGEEARNMIGRTPGTIEALHPLKAGVISEYTITEKMLRYFIQKAIGRRTLKRPRVCVGVPSGATEVERRAVMQAALEAGARDVSIIDEPLAAALGSGIDISRPQGNLIVDIGAGSTDIAVVSLCDTVVRRSVKAAGDNYDRATADYIRRKYGILIGDRTAEDVKIQIGGVYPSPENRTIEVMGRDLKSGFPAGVTISAEELTRAYEPVTRAVLDAVRDVLRQTPPELSADIATRGMLLTGGGSMLYGMDILIEEMTGIEVLAVDDPISAVAIGAGRYEEFMDSRLSRNR